MTVFRRLFLLAQHICGLVTYGNRECPFDPAWECFPEEKIGTRKFEVVGEIRSRRLLYCKVENPSIVESIDLRPRGLGEPCTDFEYTLRQSESSHLQPHVSTDQPGFTVPLTDEALKSNQWMVKYDEGHIWVHHKSRDELASICNFIRFSAQRSKLVVPSLYRSIFEVEHAIHNRFTFSFKFESGQKITFSLKLEHIDWVQETDDWIFGTIVMELLDIRLRKTGEMSKFEVMFNKIEG